MRRSTEVSLAGWAFFLDAPLAALLGVWLGPWAVSLAVLWLLGMSVWTALTMRREIEGGRFYE